MKTSSSNADNKPMDLESIAIKVARSENLPVLPQVVSSVLRLADDQNASARALEQVIERDSAITAKILRVANSAYYGLNQVGSINRAVSVLGLNAIRSLVVSIAYQQIISGKQQSVLFDRIRFWTHSLATATAAKILAKVKMPEKAEELYSAGLMHDVGMLVLDRFAPDDFDAAIRAAEGQHIPFYVAERSLWGYDHSAVGALLAKKWAIQGLIADCIRYHHDLNHLPEHADYVKIITIADHLAHESGYSNWATVISEPLPEDLTSFSGLTEEQLVLVKQVINQEVSKAADTFQIKEAA